MEPSFLVILIIAGEAGGPIEESMLRALRAASEPAYRLDVERLEPGEIAGDRLPAGADPARACFAEVRWLDPAATRVALRVRAPDQELWTERTITFDRGDADIERGRAAGLVLAAMLPPPPRSPPAPPLRSPVTSTLSAGLPAAAAPAKSPNFRPRLAVEAAGLATAAPGGDASALGARLGFAWDLSPALGLIAGVSPRFGRVDTPRARALTLVTTLGARWTMIGGAVGTVAVRADTIAMYQSLALEADDRLQPSSQSRWLPGLDALAEGCWTPGGPVALVLALGGEGVFGRTDVVVRRAQVAVFPPFRLLAELGARLWF